LKYRAVIFDLFGTLVKTWSTRQCNKVLYQIAKICGAPQETFQTLWIQGFDMFNSREYAVQERQAALVCQQLGISVTEAQVKSAAELWSAFALASMTPRLEALETLKALKSRGSKIGLISDCSSEVPAVWEKTSLAPMIDVTVFSCTAGIRKPDPRIYRMAMERLGVEPESCLYVGDGGSQELTGALNAGMYPVAYLIPQDEKPDITFTVEKWQGRTISTLSELLEIL